MSDFSGKSAKTRHFARPRRLTARLPDVGKVRLYPRDVIRFGKTVLPGGNNAGTGCQVRCQIRLQGAVIAYQSGKAQLQCGRPEMSPVQPENDK